MGALSDLRVIEIGDLVAGPFAARLLGDAGADVIKVEPPAGDESRRRGPFVEGTSALHLYLNANKRGVVVDLGQDSGMRALHLLLRDADALVVSLPAGELDRLGLRRDRLEALNPALIVTAITPFGLSGRHRERLGDDLIAVAAGGLAFATPGVPDKVADPDREPPLRANANVGDFVAGLLAANATLVAVAERSLSGRGSEVDVSRQEAVAMLMTWDIANASYGAPKGRTPDTAGVQPNAYLPCKDGHAAIVGFLEHHWHGLVKTIGDPEWAHSKVFATGAERARNWDALEPMLTEWTMQHTGAEIAALAQQNGVPCFPALSVGQMMQSDHVRARGYLRSEGLQGGLELPGFPVRMQATPWTVTRPAPTLGEHNAELLAKPLAGPRRRTSPTPAKTRASAGPLAGVRVLDFGQLIAVPFATQVLGWLGAEIVLVENARHLTNRVIPPFAEGVPGVNRAGGFNLLNGNKRSVTLDLRNPEGLALARELLSISDVVIENFAAGAADRLGVGYETARVLRPDIVYLSVAAFGRSGPLRDFTGFHSVVNLFSGLAAATGYPGGHPRIVGGFFPDFLAGSYCVLALLEALHHRANIGQGQHVEVSMTEALTTLIPEAVAEYSLTGREAERVGNRERGKAPHNVYRCKGDQQWIAISVAGEGQWRAFCEAAGHPEWAADPRFSTDATRWENQGALDELIGAWTKELDRDDTAAALQRMGAPSAPALGAFELLHDPHLIERGFVASVEHPEAGPRLMGTTGWMIDGTRTIELAPAPALGEHNRTVVTELLNRTAEEFERLERDGAFG